MYFMIFIGHDFPLFLKQMQKIEPMIHALHFKFIQLIQFLARFMKHETFQKRNQKLLGVNEIVDVSLNQSLN